MIRFSYNYMAFLLRVPCDSSVRHLLIQLSYSALSLDSPASFPGKSIIAMSYSRFRILASVTSISTLLSRRLFVRLVLRISFRGDLARKLAAQPDPLAVAVKY